MLLFQQGLRTLLFASLFLAFSASSALAVVDPSTAESCRTTGGTCHASSVPASDGQTCSGTDGEDSSCLICCSGGTSRSTTTSTNRNDLACSGKAEGDGCLYNGDKPGQCFDYQLSDGSVVFTCLQGSGGTGTASGSCANKQAYQTCRTPSGESGWCARDDEDSTGTLFCQPGSSPINPIVGGSCILANDNSVGTCQSVSTACSGGTGTTRTGSGCGSGQICCRTLTSGGGPGGTVGTGGTPGAVAGLACRGYFCWPSQTGLSSTPISTIIVRVMNWLLIILGSIAIIAFVISGIQYLIAAGDEEMMEKGKNNMKYSIIGVIVALSGLVIVRAIDMALFGNPFF